MYGILYGQLVVRKHLEHIEIIEDRYMDVITMVRRLFYQRLSHIDHKVCGLFNDSNYIYERAFISTTTDSTMLR